ncbi:response regulator [Flaviaesturariibacter amylovorans]|uniref:response regulator n=1 Tax=Flaviaesturariibacter amylovorans TaxID=1084520 RepID=UPI0031F06E15
MTPPKLILCADHSAEARYLLAVIFESINDYELITFRSGQELLFYLGHNMPGQICGVILDKDMPMMDGVETLLEIRKRPSYKITPAIIYSTNENLGGRRMPLNLHGWFFQKPNNHTEARLFIEKITELFSCP